MCHVRVDNEVTVNVRAGRGRDIGAAAWWKDCRTQLNSG